jgi:DNA-binding transcriptional MocR family regulator
MPRMTDDSKSQSDTSGLKRTYVAGTADLLAIIGDWSAGCDPLNEQLASALAQAIERGDLPAGTRLPAERELAGALGLSRTTIVSAYDRLRIANLVRSRQGSGTRVAQRRPGLTQPYLAPVPASPVPTELSTDPAVGLLTPAVDDAIEFTIGALPAAPIVATLIADTMREDLGGVLGQSGYDPFGLASLRGEVAAYLRRLGVPTDPDQVLITSGAQQALHIIGSQLGGPGGSVLVENPTYIGAIDAFRATGNRLVPVPLDRDGVRVEVMGLLAAGGPIRFGYVIPTFHNPTGVVMPAARRRELTALAAEHGFLLVEDLTPDASIGEGVPPPLAAFDPGDRVVTVGSLGKLAWGGLRIGWIRAPRSEFDRLVAGKIVADHSTSLLTQAVGARVLASIDAVAAGTRAAARLRRDVLIDALRQRLPDWTYEVPDGGLSLWVRLPGADATAFSRLAAAHGVIVRPGPLASPDGGFRDHIRLAFGTSPEQIVEGVDRLAAAWAAYGPAPRGQRSVHRVSVSV